MDIDVFRPEILVSMPDADLKTPAYSPDGQRIVFSAVYPDHHSELRIFDRATGKAAVIVTTSSPENYPQWSPDGNWIAFHQEVNGKWDIFKVRPDGSDLTNLTNDPSSDSVPVWSADSATIFFRSNRNGDTENAELFKMNADGTGQTPLPIQKGKLGWPSVSLKGDEILYAADRHNDPQLLFDIYAADIKSGTERLVISRSKHDTHPTFSYDGSRIAFVARSDGNAEIYIAKADGTLPVRLTRNPAKDSFPSLSFDGRSILFTSDRDGKAAIYELAFE
jgi:TolB protein